MAFGGEADRTVSAFARAGSGTRYDVLFEPLAIGPKIANNRFYGLPYSLGKADLDASAAAAHQGMRAEGGWSVVCCGECAISWDAGGHGLRIVTDEDVRRLMALPEAIHAHGSLALLELVHTGAIATPLEWRTPSLAASQLQFDCPRFGRAIPKAMGFDDIERVQRDWVAAARRARDAGFDLISIYGAHASLLGQFLSPFYNQRTDEYGGSLRNRARMWIETLERVREAVGGDCGIVTRVAVAGIDRTGINIEEGMAFVEMADPLVDLWDVTIGGMTNSHVDVSPSRVYPEGFPLTWTSRIHEVTRTPIAGNGRFTTADLMANLVRAGTLSMIAAARPGIADPFLPTKIAEGRFDDIRECIGCNQCAQRSSYWIGCAQNATTGEEHRRGWHPERYEPAGDPELPILIVGAGPAGMECAMVLGRRGHRLVHLVDSDRRMGGHLAWFARLPGFRPWARLTEFREQAIATMSGVQFVPSTRLDVEDVLEYGASVVIVTTGSRWSRNGVTWRTHRPIDGADAELEYILTPEQVMIHDKAPPGPRVVVIDGEGELVGVGIAQHLQGTGHDIAVATPWPAVAINAEHGGEAPTLRRELVDGGAELIPGVEVLEIRPHGVTVIDEYERVHTLECDAAVLATQRVSDDALYAGLVADPDRLRQAGIVAVHRAGDCVAPRLLSEATFEGHRVGRLLQGDGSLAADPVLAYA
jgi:dimethylamine/trimethylamine dehydrogenase